MQLPAGISPDDSSIEFFAKPGEFGKLLFAQNGRIKPFAELPESVINDLAAELCDDKKAIKGMQLMGVDGSEMLETFNFCNRGRLDSIPDIEAGGHNRMTKEFVNCGRHGKCPGEGVVCSPLIVDGFKITYRELECFAHVANQFDYKQIKQIMGFKQITAVNSLMQRLQMKTGCNNKVKLALKAVELGII